jgi:hypothetical protein
VVVLCVEVVERDFVRDVVEGIFEFACHLRGYMNWVRR